MLYVTLVALATATIVAFLPKKRTLLESCDLLISRMPNGNYEILCDFAPDEPGGKDADFWDVSKGIRGMIERLVISFICLRLVQAYRRDGRIDRDDSRIVWSKISKQILYTVLALPEAALCRCIGDAHHIAAREALRFYCELTVRTHILCVTKDAPECMLRFPELL